MTDSKAYVPGFEHDIFISYARVNNLGGWVDRFHEELRKKLAERVGRIGSVRIWYDNNLDGSQVFNQVLEDRIRKSAVFVALHSKGYLRSDYCRKELGWFHENARKSRHGLQIGERQRVVNVLLTNLNHVDWLEEFRGTSGHVLHDGKEDDVRIAEPSRPDSDDFDVQLRRLADAVYRLLEDFRRQVAPPRSHSTTPGFVYVADVADSLQALRERLVSDLKQKGREVVSEIPPPYDSGEHTAAVRSALAKASLSIHLLDAVPGRKLQNEPDSTYPRKQVELGLSSPAPQLIWVPKALEVEGIPSETQRDLLERLERGERPPKGYDFVRGHEAELLQVIVEKLLRMEVAPAPAPEMKSVLLDTHTKDQRFAFELGNYLLNQGLQPFLYQETDDPEEGFRVFETQLARVTSLIILFGHVSKTWVERRLESVIQFVARQLHSGGPALESCYLYVLPPEKERETLPSVPRILRYAVLDNSGSDRFQPEVLAPLLGAGSGGNVS